MVTWCAEEEEDEGEAGEALDGSAVLRKAKQVLESSPKQIKAAVSDTVAQVHSFVNHHAES